MTDTLTHWINGAAVPGASARFGDVYNPAAGEVVAQVPFASASEVDGAVAAALEAQPGWAATPPLRRARVISAFKELVESRKEDIARAVTREHGKVLSDAMGSVTRGIEVLEFACGIPHLLRGDYTEAVGTGIDSFSTRQPLGVVAGITPFNFPAMVPMWMFPVAIACGNAFILKPSEKDPSASTMLAEWMTEAGLPDGVFNVVHGDKEAVDAILAHPDIAALSFVGLHAHRRICLPDRLRPRQTGAGAGRRQEPRGGHAGRRPRDGERRSHRGCLRLRRRALHGGLGGGGGRRPCGRRADRGPQAQDRPHQGWGPAPTQRPTWGRW